MDMTFTLLKTRFFLNLEDGNETDMKAHYEDMRSIIVSFVHSSLNWREIHTGLTMFISEVSHIIGDTIGKKLRGYAARILEIAKGLLRQLELLVENGVTTSCETGEPKCEESPKVEKKVRLSSKYTAVCEIINMIISMKMINGGNITSNEIISRVHRLFGLDYPSDKYYKTRGEIIRRSPEDGDRAYFLMAAVRTLNYEYANA